MDLQTVSSTYAQRNFSKLLNELDRPVTVLRDSEPEAVVVPYEDYRGYLRYRRKMMEDKVRRALAPVHAQTEKMPDKELDILVKEALHAAGRD